MLKKQRNQVFDIIINEGFNIKDFDLVIENERANKLVVKDSELWFTFLLQEQSYDSFKYVYSRFIPKPNSTASSIAAPFEKALLGFKSWLKSEVKELIEERDGEDLFENFRLSQEEFNFKSFDTDIHQKFAADDIELIKTKIGELHNYLLERFEVTHIQGARIEAGLNYLAEAVETSTKFDWRGTFVSTFLSILTTLSLDTNSGSQLWAFIVNLFSDTKFFSK